MAAQVERAVAPIAAVALPTEATHPFTHSIKFNVSPDAVGLVSVEGFRNLLEAHMGTLSKTKQTSYTRSEVWLNAIRDNTSKPPAGYKGKDASWKNEIGYTHIATSRWVVEGGKVYKKNATAENGRESQPETPTEDLYDTLTKVHAQYGHKGRDGFFANVQKVSGSITKALCHQFVQVCCDKASSWDNGKVPYGWQATVTRRVVAPVAAVNDLAPVNHAVDNNTNAAAGVEQHANPAQEIRQDNQQRAAAMAFDAIPYHHLDMLPLSQAVSFDYLTDNTQAPVNHLGFANIWGVAVTPNTPWHAPQRLGGHGHSNGYHLGPNYAGQKATPAHPPAAGRQSPVVAGNTRFLNENYDPMLSQGMDDTEFEALIASNPITGGPNAAPVDPDRMDVDMPLEPQSQAKPADRPFDMQDTSTWGFVPFNANPF